MIFGNALTRFGSLGSCPKEVRMSLVGTLAKVALGVAAVKGAGYVASQMAGGKGSSVVCSIAPGLEGHGS